MRVQYGPENVQVTFDQLIYSIGSYHYNWHNEIELLWLIEGKMEAAIDGQSYIMHEGDLVLINSNYGHATFSLAARSIAMRLYISPDFFLSQGLDLSEGAFQLNSAISKNDARYADIRYFLAMLYLTSKADGHNKLALHTYFFNIAHLVAAYYVPSGKKDWLYTTGQKKELFDGIKAYIEENFSNELTLEKLAIRCNYSVPYLSKLFKTELGINFYEYLTRCRLQQAVRDLGDCDATIASIAAHTGFNDVKSFNKMFKKHFGITPSEYRNSLSELMKDQDARFKKSFDQNEQAFILEKLAQHQNMYGAEAELHNPCETCAVKAYEAKYTALLETLRDIIK